jgi:hypothetical protein
MKISKRYQNTLAYRRSSTNIISCSWSVFYRGEYINGANYNGVTILSSVLPCGLIVYSKNMDRIKGYIRAYKQKTLVVQ